MAHTNPGEHVLIVEKKKSTESFKKTDHFGGELKYFSDCILNNKNPRPTAKKDSSTFASCKPSSSLSSPANPSL